MNNDQKLYEYCTRIYNIIILHKLKKEKKIERMKQKA